LAEEKGSSEQEIAAQAGCANSDRTRRNAVDGESGDRAKGHPQVFRDDAEMAGRLVELSTLELDISISSFGSTTWRRQALGKGLEADRCYYIQSEPIVRGRTDIDLERDPAPDLANEIDIPDFPLNRPSVYAALGVGELWRYDGARFNFVRRTTSSNYEPIASSVALPFMTPQIVDRFIGLVLADENAGLRAFRDWLRTLS
jgi:hypothetical protein